MTLCRVPHLYYRRLHLSPTLPSLSRRAFCSCAVVIPRTRHTLASLCRGATALWVPTVKTKDYGHFPRVLDMRSNGQTIGHDQAVHLASQVTFQLYFEKYSLNTAIDYSCMLILLHESITCKFKKEENKDNYAVSLIT